MIICINVWCNVYDLLLPSLDQNQAICNAPALSPAPRAWDTFSATSLASSEYHDTQWRKKAENSQLFMFSNQLIHFPAFQPSQSSSVSPYFVRRSEWPNKVHLEKTED